MTLRAVSEPTITDDDGTRTTGSIFNAAFWTDVFARIDAQLDYAPLDICQGRLTLATGTPVTTANQTAKTTVYWTPYKGNRVALYSSSAWRVYTFSELSIALGTDTTAKPYDVFAYNNSGTVAIERLVWTDGTTRATALTTQDGVLVKSGDATRRYLGTYYTSGTGQTEDSFSKRFVWNYYNRAVRPMRAVESTSNWTYSTATWRQARATSANKVEIVVGVAEVRFYAEITAAWSNDNAGNINSPSGIGEDSTSAAASADGVSFYGTSLVANRLNLNTVTLTNLPTVGYHYYAWLEQADATGTTTWYGAGTGLQSGLTAEMDG